MELGAPLDQLMDLEVGSGGMDPGSEDIDECEQDKFLCGIEAGCFNTLGSYVCLCTDLQPVNENNSCHRGQESSINTSSVTDHFQPAPKESAFGTKQLEKMLTVSKPVGNGTDGNSSQYQNTTSYFMQSSEVADTQSVVLLACLCAVALMTALSVATCIWRRRRRYFPWLPFCLSRKRSHLTSAAALGKCMQQYVTNPNYYSNSPDAPLLKTLRDMEIPHENITFMEEIGEGCFGKVHKGIYTPNQNVSIPIAVKILKDGTNTDLQAHIEREVEIMSTFNHENILKLIGIVFKADSASMPWMVFEFMQFGDLAELLRNNSPRLRRLQDDIPFILTQPDLIWVANQIASGMVYLSSQHFVHRDLATRNCLVGENLTVKISDFGMSRDIYTSDYYKIGGCRMLPIRWMAPESITYGKFSLESDVWSYGVVLWEIFTLGKQPYYGHSNDEVVKLILQGILLSPPENCPSFIYSIMAGCWKTEPRDRLTFPEIFNLLVANSPDRRSSLHNDQEILLDSDNYLIPNVVTVV